MKDKNLLPKTITIPSRITADRFGANHKLFNQHIKGKELQTISRHGKYIYVEAGNGETYSIHVDDLISDEDFREMQEREFEAWKEGLTSDQVQAVEEYRNRMAS